MNEATANDPTNTLTKTTDIIDLSEVELVYSDESGNTHVQPLGDLTEAGTLIDPETGDDLDLIEVLVAGRSYPLDVLMLVYVDENDDDPEYADEEFEQSASDLAEAGTLIHPESGAVLDIDHAYLIRR